MTTLDLDPAGPALQSDHVILLHRWRLQQLVRLGIPDLVAELVADSVDWHEIEELVGDGCSPELALDIVR